MTKRLVAALLTAALFAAAPRAQAASAKHSLNEYAYLIGTWSCTAHVPGRKERAYTTTFKWLFADKTAIDQTFQNAGGQAHFMLTYDKRRDDFRGVFVGDDGSIGTWTNPGAQRGAWTELGYDLDADGYPENSIAHFHDVTPTHYAFAFRFRDPKGIWSTENDVCRKK